MKINSSIIGLAIAFILIIGGAWYVTKDKGGVNLPVNIFTSYSVDSSYFNGSALFTVNASKDGVSLDNLDVFVSYGDGDTFQKVVSIEDITLPKTVNISVPDGKTELKYYVILKNGMESIRLPKAVDTYKTLNLSSISIEDPIVFSTLADFNPLTNITLITLSSSYEVNETIKANLFTSYDNLTFENVENKTASVLPMTFEVEKEEGHEILYYYLDVIFRNETSTLKAESITFE